MSKCLPDIIKDKTTCVIGIPATTLNTHSFRHHAEIGNLVSGCQNTNLGLNVSKTKYLRGGGNDKPCPHNRDAVETVYSFKFPGIHISSNLS